MKTFPKDVLREIVKSLSKTKFKKSIAPITLIISYLGKDIFIASRVAEEDIFIFTLNCL